MKKETVIFLLFFVIALIMGSVSARADIIRGRVVDSETKETLPEATVKFTQQFGDYGMSMWSVKTDSLGVFTASATSRVTMEVSMLGYYSKKKTVLAFSDSRSDTIDVGTIELKMSPQMMKMVEVTGHARRFTVRGDTIVFNPEAFHLQEGARLDELIRKLPGVEVDDNGHMSWNGKPIRLTMDGESLLGGDQLIKQLPAEAVQDIKAYNKASEFAERTKKDDGTQDMVLDLTIKPGFLDRWYGDVKAAYQTKKYYDTELSMNRLSKSDPMMVFANANNIDKKWRRSMNGSWGSIGNGFGKEQGGAAGYQHKWQKKEGTQEMKSQYSFSGNIANDNDRRSSGTESETYFPNTAASRWRSETLYTHHQLNPSFNADLRWAKDSLNTYSVRASIEHDNHQSDNHEEGKQEMTDEYQMTNDELSGVYVPVLSQLVNTHGEGRRTKLESRVGWDHYIKDGSLGASVTMEYVNRKDENWTQRDIQKFTTEALSGATTTTQYSLTPATNLSLNADAYHSRWLTKKWMMQGQYSFRYSHNLSDCDFMTNGMTDAANSYHNLYSTTSHNLRLAQTINLSPVQLMPSVTAQWQHEDQEYRRGNLDTTAVRNFFRFDPSLHATLKVTKTIGFELNYSYHTSKPEIIQTIAYRDLTNPLYIIEGNPDLKDSHTHDISLNYSMVIAHSQTNISTTVSHQNSDRDVTNALSYTPETAVYVSRSENVKGLRSWNFKLNIDQALGDYFRLQNDLRLTSLQLYGYLTRVVEASNPPSLGEGQGVGSLNRQWRLNPSNRFRVSYDKDWLKASAYANISPDRLRYTASPEQNTTLWNNRFGFEAEATWGNFVFETEIMENMRRGYTVESMNRNLFLWNAAVTWKILKNKAHVKLEVEDILNNEDGFWSQQSAYQTTTSWQDFRHHYAGISFTYHLDAKKKD